MNLNVSFFALISS